MTKAFFAARNAVNCFRNASNIY